MYDSNPIIQKIFPDLSMVSKQEQDVFFDSNEGKRLQKLIENRDFELSVFFSDSMLTRFARGISTGKKIKDFQNSIKHSASFLRLKDAIIQHHLNHHLFEFRMLSKEQQQQLVSTEYSKRLYESRDIKAWYAELCDDTQESALAIKDELKKQTKAFHEMIQDQIGFLFNLEPDNSRVHYYTAWIYDLKSTSEDKKVWLIEQLKPTVARNKMWEAQDRAKYFEPYFKPPTFSSVFNNIISDEAREYLNRIADTHTFYQILGLSTENGGWELDYLDLYNYSRNEESIYSLKNVLYTLIKPQHALFHEYVQIARYEKNMFNIVFRAVVPILVMGLFIVIGFDLIAPFVIPELVEFLMIFPALYLASAAASVYVELKNIGYRAFIDYWWGDIYNTPEFQDNGRMLKAFKNDSTLVKSITDFYTSNLRECDKIERNLIKESKGGLSQEQLDAQKSNKIRVLTLLMEWHKIESEPELGYDKIPAIVKARLYEDGLIEYKKLNLDVALYVNKFVDELDTHLKTNTTSQMDNNRWSFFSNGHESDLLKQRCIAEKQKIACIETLYPQVASMAL